MARDLAARLQDGKAKLYLTAKTLCLRKNDPDLFRCGGYTSLKASGPRADHIVAFAREYKGRSAIVAAPRLNATLLSEERNTLCDETLWADTYLEVPQTQIACYHNLFTGECLPLSNNQKECRSLPVSKLLRFFPVALLASEPVDREQGCADSK